MADHGTTDGPGTDDDEELGKVDQRGEESALYENISLRLYGGDTLFTYQKDHCPFVTRHNRKSRKFVSPWDDVQEQNPADWSLVKEELKPIDVVLSLVGRNPNRIYSTAEHTYQSNHHGQEPYILDFGTNCGFRFIVGDDTYPYTHWNQAPPGFARYYLVVEHEVKENSRGGEEDSRNLIECNG